MRVGESFVRYENMRVRVRMRTKTRITVRTKPLPNKATKTTLTLKTIVLSPGNTNGLNDKLLGHIGVNTSAEREGWTMGPPAERE